MNTAFNNHRHCQRKFTTMTVGIAKMRIGAEVSCGRGTVDEIRCGTTNVYKMHQQRKFVGYPLLNRKTVNLMQCSGDVVTWSKSATSLTAAFCACCREEMMVIFFKN